MARRFTAAQLVAKGLISEKEVVKIAIPSNGSRADHEGDEQILLLDEFRARHPEHGALLIHIRNGGSLKGRFEGYRFKKQGVRPGVSDLLLPVARGGFFGLWIEFKASPPFSAPVTPEQQMWIAEMLDEGYFAATCKGLPPAIRLLDAYLGLPATPICPSRCENAAFLSGV